MVIYVDTREQKPLEFSPNKVVEQVVRAKLPYGDYGCKNGGDRIPVVFERKSLGDLFGTLGKGYKRFRKEINRAIEDGVLLIIIIEVDLLKVKKGYKHSKMKGIGVVRTLMTLMTKHHIPFVCCKNRKEMELYISEFYYSWIKNQ